MASGSFLALDLDPVAWQAITTALMAAGVFFTVWLGYRPMQQWIAKQEEMYESVLTHKLLMDIRPRSATYMAAAGAGLLAIVGCILVRSYLGLALGLAGGLLLPSVVMRFLRARYAAKLDKQLVSGIHTITSGVKAGLNLVQSMEMVASEAPPPMGREFDHLLREYEYGMPLEEAMNNAATRIESSDYRLLFTALETHRQRGGDLGETLTRIGQSIREIQRLENRVQALTAEGRATAYFMGAMPLVVLVILYLFVDRPSVVALFQEGLGNVILLAIVLLNVIGFLWIRRIVAVDI